MKGFTSGFVSYDRSSNELVYGGVSIFSSGQSKRVGRGDSSTAAVEILLELYEEMSQHNTNVTPVTVGLASG